MKIEIGNNRIVIVFNKIVIKLPRIHFCDFITLFIRYSRKGRLKFLMAKKYQKSDYSFSWCLFKGFIDNWSEFCFFRRYKLSILIPTYYSLFGLFNIQHKGEKLNIRAVDLHYQLYRLTNSATSIDTHTFANPKNFCVINNRFKILNYANRKVQNVMKKHGNKIYRKFNFSYTYR